MGFSCSSAKSLTWPCCLLFCPACFLSCLWPERPNLFSGRLFLVSASLGLQNRQSKPVWETDHPHRSPSAKLSAPLFSVENVSIKAEDLMWSRWTWPIGGGGGVTAASLHLGFQLVKGQVFCIHVELNLESAVPLEWNICSNILSLGNNCL